jgi:transposase-like protein
MGMLQGLRGQVGRRYETISASWRNNWERVVPFLDFPPEVRKVIYTTTRSSR